jgi:hypothetical protein
MNLNQDMQRYTAVIRAVQNVLVDELSPWVETGAAVFEPNEAGGSSAPRRPDACAFTVYAESEREVSFFPVAPGTNRTPTIDIYDKDSAALVREVREYVRAIVAGRIEFTLKKGSPYGRVRVSLPDGRARTHVYNVFLWFAVGRGPRWETFRASPY